MTACTVEEFHTRLASGELQGAQRIQFQGPLPAIPPAIYALADTLEILDVSNTGLCALPEDLPRLHKLRVLFASGNPFTSLPTVLGRMPALQMVGFKSCRIVDVPAASLPAALRWLILTDNQITTLPDALGQCQHLQKLMLACNQLHAIPASIAACERLELLRLSSNQLPHLPAALLKLPRLAWLALSGNPFTEQAETQALQQANLPTWQMDEVQLGTQLGQGASGHVYAAQTRHHAAPIAVKQFKALRTSDGSPQAELAASLACGQHPHLLTPLAQITDASSALPATAFTLLPASYAALAAPPDFTSCTRDVYRSALPLNVAQAATVMAQLRSAVEHLHARGITHGDVYGHNLLWSADTGSAMLSDFGAASLIQYLPQAQQQALMDMELRAVEILQTELFLHSTLLP